MSLETPEKVGGLERKLYVKAKAEPEFRFYLLYDKVYREDILEHAYKLAKANRGALAWTGVTWSSLRRRGRGVAVRLTAGAARTTVQTTVRSSSASCGSARLRVRRVTIPKPGGGERPLGIPTIRDRVVQTAVKIVIEPVLEADLSPYTFGYRPRKSALDAIKIVRTRGPRIHRCGGRRFVQVFRYHSPF